MFFATYQWIEVPFDSIDGHRLLPGAIDKWEPKFECELAKTFKDNHETTGRDFSNLYSHQAP